MVFNGFYVISILLIPFLNANYFQWLHFRCDQKHYDIFDGHPHHRLCRRPQVLLVTLPALILDQDHCDSRTTDN